MKSEKVMKSKIALFISFSILISGILGPNLIQAKRAAPKKVSPVIYNDMKYMAPHSLRNKGFFTSSIYIEAWNIKTDEKLWEKKMT